MSDPIVSHAQIFNGFPLERLHTSISIRSF